MKSTGMVRRMDKLGRIVIPKELLRTLGIANGDPMEIFVTDDQIALRKYAPGCAQCGGMDNLVTRGTLTLCPACVAEFKEAIE